MSSIEPTRTAEATLVIRHARTLCSQEPAHCAIASHDPPFATEEPECPQASPEELIGQCRDGLSSTCACIARSRAPSSTRDDAVHVMLSLCKDGDLAVCTMLGELQLPPTRLPLTPDQQRDWQEATHKHRCYLTGTECRFHAKRLMTLRRLDEARDAAELGCQQHVEDCFLLASTYKSGQLHEPYPGRWRDVLAHVCRYSSGYPFTRMVCRHGKPKPEYLGRAPLPDCFSPGASC